MRKATFLYLCAALLLIGVVLVLALSFGKANQRASAEEIAQGDGIMWNATDYNNTYLQNAYSGPQTILPRIAEEYADCLVTIRTRIAFDLNMDRKCNMKDVGLVAKAFGLTPDFGKWNEALDINGDFKVDMKDVASLAKHYGEHYP